ncbi:MAG TPA: hypothetical protein VGB06_10940 [Solirubrobacterales bacterium]
MALAAVVATFALAASVASAHALKMVRASNANNQVAKGVCKGFVNDETLGTCVDWTSGPCRRVSAHQVRCQMTHVFRHENGMEVRCRQAQEWFLAEGSGELDARLVPKSVRCRETRPPDPVTP